MANIKKNFKLAPTDIDLGDIPKTKQTQTLLFNPIT